MTRTSQERARDVPSRHHVASWNGIPPVDRLATHRGPEACQSTHRPQPGPSAGRDRLRAGFRVLVGDVRRDRGQGGRAESPRWEVLTSAAKVLEQPDLSIRVYVAYFCEYGDKRRSAPTRGGRSDRRCGTISRRKQAPGKRQLSLEERGRPAPIWGRSDGPLARSGQPRRQSRRVPARQALRSHQPWGSVP
jgi:hypothetical protein